MEEFNDIQSVSELIRFSVEKEITEREKDDNQDLQEIRETLATLLEINRQINTHTSEIKDDTDYLQKYTATAEEIEALLEGSLSEFREQE
mgnify:FL=1